MKTTIRTLLLLLFTTFLACGSLFTKQTHVVTLQIDLEILNQENPSIACTLSADADTDVEGDSTPENFTIVVNEEDTIEWKAISATGEEIDIESIEFFPKKGQKKPFKSNKLNGKRNNSNKKKVKEKLNKKIKGNAYKYNIKFSINGDNFTIDPKIKIN